ncbi:MAG: geranylgeranylglyceryl/heptaprenylglyceryl phosphate synthase [Bacteroidales bacterium]|nr:geranylgeranylglyceryl/heptaprenylglyceryl phosphate synthase [Bacteroidales bacterium]
MSSCLEQITSGEKKFGLLIDPDSYTRESLIKSVDNANKSGVHFILIGGSLVTNKVDSYIEIIKERSNIPVLLFPGSLLQLSDKADALLFISLLSGRNPEFLVGNHVIAAPFIKSRGIECIPTAYILIEGGVVSSVEYMSNTKPIPRNKTDIIIATAIAGELMGNKLIYLECGSGAKEPLSADIVKEVCKNVSIPVIVGGGLHTPGQIKDILVAGAKMVIVGNALENNNINIHELVRSVK